MAFKIPDVITSTSYAFGYTGDRSDTLIKQWGCVPIVGTVIGLCRADEAWKNQHHRGLISRISQFVRAIFEMIPVVNLILIPIDFVATLGIKAYQAIPNLLPNFTGGVPR